MMPRLDTRSRRLSGRINTPALAVGLAACFFAAASPLPAQQIAETQKLEVSPVRQAFSVAENWVRRGSVPDSTLAIRMKGVSAVHVTLRKGGPTFGQATETIANPADPASANPGGEAQQGVRQQGPDLMKLVRPAVKRALRQAYGRIGRSTDLSVSSPRMTLDLQVAGVPQRVELESLGDLPPKITINVHGLALRRGSKWAWQFPGNSIAANTSLHAQIQRLLSAADLPVGRIQTVGQPNGPALYRFNVVHVVRPGPDQPVVELHRGNQPLPSSPLGDRALASLGRQLADYLLGRQRENGRFAGTYRPTADQYRPSTASDFDGGYAAFALARAARLPGLGAARRATLSEGARQAVQALVKWVAVPSAQRDGRPRRLAPTAATLLALLETPGLAEMKNERIRLVAALKTLHREDGLFDMSTADRTPAPLMMQGLGAAALVALFDQRRDPAMLERARQTLEAIWSRRGSTSPGVDFESTLPWLAYAELNLARLGHATKHLKELDALCRKIWDRQIVPWEEPASGEPSPDAIGGFIQPNTIMEEPTWETAPRLATQALMLRRPDRVPGNQRARWMIRCGLGARFLSQLTMDRANCYYCRSPAAAVGGTRLTFWNNRQPLSATAASLLAVTELRHSLHEIRQATEAKADSSSSGR